MTAPRRPWPIMAVVMLLATYAWGNMTYVWYTHKEWAWMILGGFLAVFTAGVFWSEVRRFVYRYRMWKLDTFRWKHFGRIR